jgi:phosphatidylglycerol lysyltransferase
MIGLILVMRPLLLFVGEHLRSSRLIRIDPFGISPSLVLTLTGILLIYFVLSLYRCRRRAYLLSILLISCSIVVLLGQKHHSLVIFAMMGIAILWLLFSYRLYTVQSDMISLRFGVKTALLLLSIGYVYGVLGFLLLGHLAFHQAFSLHQSLILSFQVLFTLHDVEVPTNQAEIFVHSIDIISGLIFILVVASLFKPVRFALGSQKKDWIKAKEILHVKSQSSEDYFKLWPNDKHYFFSLSGCSFLAYKTSGRTAIILGDPSGEQEEFERLIIDFHVFVTSNGWRVASINATSISQDTFTKRGFIKQFIGREAVIPIAQFTSRTSHSKHFRYVTNKAERDGLSVEYLHSVTDEQLMILKKISDAWLSRSGRREYTFFMGYFDGAYLRASDVILLRQRGEAVAYISILPSFMDDEVSIDHLRSLPAVSSVAMHFLLLKLVEVQHTRGKRMLNIGMVPLSGIESKSVQNLFSDRLLALIKKFGNRYYSFKGAEQFKKKSDPIWYERYLYYTGSAATLPLVMRDIEHASSRRLYDRTRKQRIVTGITAIASLAIFVQFI